MSEQKNWTLPSKHSLLLQHDAGDCEKDLRRSDLE